jgi:hypothetical protein
MSTNFFENNKNEIEKLNKERGELLIKNKELKAILRENQLKASKLKEEIDNKLNEQKVLEYHMDTYKDVLIFYKNAINEINKIIPNIVTKLTIKLIEKAIARGANIFQNYSTLSELKHINNCFGDVYYTTKKFINSDILNNYELFHRIIINKINLIEPPELF